MPAPIRKLVDTGNQPQLSPEKRVSGFSNGLNTDEFSEQELSVILDE